MSAIAQNPWLMVLAIFIINVCYVTFLTMRTILTLKGYRYVAAVVSFMEVLVYVVGLGLVMSSLDQIQNIFAYALGFSVGIIVGMKIEEKLALGYTVVKNLDPKAFIIAYEPRNIHGGFWVKGVRKRKLKAYEPEQLEVVVDHEEIVGGSSNEQKV